MRGTVGSEDRENTIILDHLLSGLDGCGRLLDIDSWYQFDCPVEQTAVGVDLVYSQPGRVCIRETIAGDQESDSYCIVGNRVLGLGTGEQQGECR